MGQVQPVRWQWSASLIIVVTVLAVLPALVGDWVYDDRIMPGHPLLDDLEDLVGVFTHTSADYFAGVRTKVAPVATGVTYRPISMFTLALTNALFGPEPLWHHLFSAALHAACMLALFRILVAMQPVTLRGTLLVACFALHPVCVEAYGWINGRSDVIAGLALLVLYYVQICRPGRHARAAETAVVLAVGAFAKETFLVAALPVLLVGVSAAWQRGAASSARRRAVLSATFAWLFSLALLLSARRLAAGGTTPSIPAVSLREAAERLPRLIALGFESLLIPLPRGMRLLSWELARPVGLTQAGLLTALGMTLVLLARRRQYNTLVLVGGAMATLAPALLVSRGFWFGFDRYLYMPLCLLALALVPHLGGSSPASSESRRTHRVLLVALALPVLLATATRASSRAYASQQAFVRAMVETRPEDPSGYLYAAQEALLQGEREVARRFMLSMPSEHLPLAHAHRAVDALLELGEVDVASHVAEAAWREHVDEPRVLLGLARVRFAQARWDEAAVSLRRAVAHTPADDASKRSTLQRRLREMIASQQAPPQLDAELRRLLTSLSRD